MFCAFSVMALVYFSLKDRWRIKNVVLIAYFTIYVTLSGSRNALIFIIFGVVIYPFLFNGNRDDFGKRFLKVVLVTAVVCGTVVAVIKIPYLYNLIGYRVQDVLEGFSSGDFSESSASSRNTMLVTGMNKENIHLWPHVINDNLDYFFYDPKSFIKAFVGVSMDGFFLKMSVNEMLNLARGLLRKSMTFCFIPIGYLCYVKRR